MRSSSDSLNRTFLTRLFNTPLRAARGIGLSAAVGLVLLASAWMLTVADRLNQVGIPRPDAAAGEALFPGNAALPHPAVSTQGDWVTQQVGGQTFLATRAAGATLTIPFYGTSLSLTARTGPDAGRVYVTVDGAPVPGLPRDDAGTFLTLRAPKAAGTVVLVTAELRPGHHVVTLTNTPGVELAVSSVEVSNRPGLGWVLSLAFSALTGLLFIAIRSSWRALAETRGWLRPVLPPEKVEDDSLA